MNLEVLKVGRIFFTTDINEINKNTKVICFTVWPLIVGSHTVKLQEQYISECLYLIFQKCCDVLSDLYRQPF